MRVFLFIGLSLVLLCSGCVTTSPTKPTFAATPYSSGVLNIEGSEPPMNGPAWFPEHIITQQPTVVGRSIAMGQ